MSYMTISSQENHHFLLCAYFHAHPTTLLLKILGGDQCMGRPPTSHLGGGPSPPVPPRSPPLVSPSVELLGPMILQFSNPDPRHLQIDASIYYTQIILFFEKSPLWKVFSSHIPAYYNM